MELRSRSGRSQPLLAAGFVLFLTARLRSVCAGDCPADGRTWVPFGDRCYHFVHGEEDAVKSYTLQGAHSLCTGFELLTVQSPEENDFVMKYSPSVWKGNVNVWLGMYYDTNGDTMRWLNEQPLVYTNWEPGYPSDLPPADSCVALHSYTGKWENVSCSNDVENGVICEAAQQVADKPRAKPSALISALVILSVVAVVGVSAVIWFVHQRHGSGSPVFTAFEYHPPFRVLDTDKSCLVEAEETESVP